MSAPDGYALERRTRELHALTEVAKTLTVPFDLPALLGAVMNKIEHVIDSAEIGVIMLWDESAGLFRPEAAFGYDLKILSEMGLRAGESITGKVYDKGIAQLLTTRAEVAEAMADMRLANRATMTRALGSEALPRSAVAAPPRAGEAKPPAIRDAQQADRLRSEVIATLSHELRTPLAAIKGYATALLLEEVGWPDEKRREFLHLIDEECDNLQAMISDILDSSLIDVGQFVIERQPVRLERL